MFDVVLFSFLFGIIMDIYFGLAFCLITISQDMVLYDQLQAVYATHTQKKFEARNIKQQAHTLHWKKFLQFLASAYGA